MTRPDDWVTPASRRRRRKRASASTPRDWLPKTRGRRTTATKSSAAGNGRPPQTRRVGPPQPLRGNGRQVGEETGVAALQARIAELEDQLEKASRKITDLRGELKGEVPTDGTLDANAATFEQLRAVGLSITQSVKLISRREQQGGFRSKVALSRTPGLSDRAREVIRDRLTVSRS